MRLGHRTRSTLLSIVATSCLAFAVLAARGQAASQTQITVYAAASLTDVFPKIDGAQRYSFGGSNTLSAQIQQGAPADVFASANMTLPNQLYAKGLCSKPVVLTRNTLVIVVPKANPAGSRASTTWRSPGPSWTSRGRACRSAATRSRS